MQLNDLIDTIGEDTCRKLLGDWQLIARPEQLPPCISANQQDWIIWLMLGGRGSGKTRAGAEWVRHMALGLPPFASEPARRIALVGPTLAEVRSVMVEGQSGLLALHTDEDRPEYEPSKRQLVWKNGTIAQLYSSERPNSLRGPQFDACWCDELAKWHKAKETWDMLQFAMRLGDAPRQVITTTPLPIPLLRQLVARKDISLTRLKTHDNADNLAPEFINQLESNYGGSILARQELYGELITDNPDALFSGGVFEDHRVDEAPDLARVVVAVDPPASKASKSSVCGIVCAGVASNGRAYVLEDASIKQASPKAWASHAIALYHRRKADRIIAEVNQGGDMVETIIRELDPLIAYKSVRASRGKRLRAEPVAAIYEQGRVSHVGRLPDLEREMLDFDAMGLAQGHSPDRLDALVWALTELLLKGGKAEPRIRTL